VDEAKEELKEVIEFFKDPSQIPEIGGKIPKGALLLGPPGSAKPFWLALWPARQGCRFFDVRI